MSKELPKMYQSVINKDISNIQKVYSTLDLDHNIREKKGIDKNPVDGFVLRQKINSIFNSNSFIYKADVTIVTKDKTTTKRIIGKNNDNLITMDNEYIPISSIIDIYK